MQLYKNKYNSRLHTQFKESPEGSVQLSIVHSMMAENFPGIGVTVLSRLIRDAFPSATVKRLGKKRVTFIVGIELRQQPSLDFSPASVNTSCFPLSVTTTNVATVSSQAILTTATSSPFLTTASSSSTLSQMTDLLMELERERKKRVALELEVEMLKKGCVVQSADEYQQNLCSEIESAVCSRKVLLHGPDTVERFEHFSMSAVIAELQATCPEVYKLVQQLAHTQRNAKDGVLPDEELKGVMAICTLLNARSARVKGLQLMVSLMLVARAIGRQVR